MSGVWAVPIYEVDSERRYLNVVLMVHPSFLDSSGVSVVVSGGRKMPRTREWPTHYSHTRRKGCMISKGFYSHLGLRAVNSRFRRILAQLAEDGCI